MEKGGRVRLRIINGATATGFTIDTGALDGEVIAVDGQDIVPLKTRQIPAGHGPAGGPAAGRSRGKAAPSRSWPCAKAVFSAPASFWPAGATVAKIADAGEAAGPVLSLASEMGLGRPGHSRRRSANRQFTRRSLGNMQDYSWGMQSNAPLSVARGDRVLVEMRNHVDDDPSHASPWASLPDRRHQWPTFAGAVRDTVIVPHMTSVTFAFDAINPGKAWAFHCHHLYHMATGMMATIGYEGA